LRTRRLLLGAGALALLAVVAMWTWLLVQPRPGITWAKYKRIRVGMTLAEVEAILGRPADETVRVALEPPVPPGRAWEGGGLRVTVWLDHAGAVSGKDLQPGREDTLLERLRRLLPR
jgi:hypothetical protein